MSKSNKINVKNKVYILGGVLLLNLCVVSGLAYYGTTKLVGHIDDLTLVQLPSTQFAGRVDMMHDGIRGAAFRAILASSAGQEEKKEVFEDYQSMVKNMNSYIAEIDKITLDDDTKIAFNEAKPIIASYIKEAESVVGPALAGQKAIALDNVAKLQDTFKELEGRLDKFQTLVQHDASGTEAAAEREVNWQKRLNIILGLIGFAVGIFTLVIVVRDLTKTLSSAVHELNSEAEEVKKTSYQVSETASKISAASSQQAAAIQETAASVEEITAMVKKTSESSVKLGEAAQLSQAAATRGQNSVQFMLKAIADISASNTAITNRVEESNNRITDIVKVIGEIGNKTKVINDIVFQTKLLSFNASVEAARAGEHGKGFAVVAEEVGNLAQMSGTAAKEITEMLDSSILKVSSIVNETKSSVDSLVAEGKSKTQVGVEVAKQCGVSLDEISKQVNDVDVMIQEIVTAISEQTQGITEISKAIAELDTATQQNSVTASQSSEVAEELLNKASSVVSIVTELEGLTIGQGAGLSHLEDAQTVASAERDERTAGNVREFRAPEAKKAVKKINKLKVVRGGSASAALAQDLDVPDENDPRFKDV